MSRPTLPVSEFTFSVQGCAKYRQQCHGLPRGHLYTLEHRGSSEQEEAQWPATCLGRIGSRLLPQKYSGAGHLSSSCKTGLPSWGPAHCLHSYVVCETPTSFSAQHHAMLCSCVYRSQFPPQSAASWEEKAPCSSVGAGLLADRLFILKREHKRFLKCRYAFLNASCPKALLLPACNWHFTWCWAKALYKESPGQSWEKGSALASHGDGGQAEMQPLCMLTTALSSVILQALLGVVLLCMVWLAPSYGESRGDEWSDPTVPNGCISLLHLCRASGHTPKEVLRTLQLPAGPHGQVGDAQRARRGEGKETGRRISSQQGVRI